MKLVFKIGGSVMCPGDYPDTSYIRKISQFLVRLGRKRNDIVVVTGGGSLIKKYMESVRKFHPREEFLDEIGIMGTRLNSMLLISSLGRHAFPEVIDSRKKLKKAVRQKKIAVACGFAPGKTTDTISMQIAEELVSDMVIKVTNVDGVYTKDPEKHRNARLLKEVHVRDLTEITKSKRHRAGGIYILDPVSVRILKRSRIPVVVTGKDIKNMERMLENRKFVGTSITYE